MVFSLPCLGCQAAGVGLRVVGILLGLVSFLAKGLCGLLGLFGCTFRLAQTDLLPPKRKGRLPN